MTKTSLHSEKIKRKDFAQLLRLRIVAEMEAINLYEQMAALADDSGLKNILLDMAKEKKAHEVKLHALLLREDKEQEKAPEEGKKRVNEASSASNASVKPSKEQKAIKPASSAVNVEKPQPILPAEKTAIKPPEEPKMDRPIESAMEAEKPRTAPSLDTANTMKHGSNLAADKIIICSNCGYKVNGPAPNKCPGCGAQSGRFKIS